MAWSLVNFSGAEMIKIAKEIEVNGKLFYEKAQNKVNDAKVKDIFGTLAAEEAQHIIDFTQLGERLAKIPATPNESYAGEYGDYMQSIVDSHIFNQNNVDELVNGLQDGKQALDIAFRFEKDSIMIFQEFKNVVDESGKDVVEDLIRQEKEHISKLTKMSKAL